MKGSKCRKKISHPDLERKRSKEDSRMKSTDSTKKNLSLSGNRENWRNRKG